MSRVIRGERWKRKKERKGEGGDGDGCGKGAVSIFGSE